MSENKQFMDIIENYDKENLDYIPQKQLRQKPQIQLFTTHNMPRVECFYHEGQYITNVCRSKGCVIPVCPLCIHVHSLEHIDKGSYPIFECLETMLNDVQQSVNTEITKFSNCYQEIQNYSKSFDSLSTKALSKIKSLKQRVIDVVDQFFDSLESQVAYKQSKNYTNTERDMQHLLKMIRERLESMTDLLEQLNSAECLKSIIPFYTTTFQEDNSQYYKKINEYINNFPKVASDVYFNQSRISELNLMLKSIIQVNHQKIQNYTGMHQLPITDVYQSDKLNQKDHLKESIQIQRSQVPCKPGSDRKMTSNRKRGNSLMDSQQMEFTQPQFYRQPSIVEQIPLVSLAQPYYQYRPPYHKF